MGGLTQAQRDQLFEKLAYLQSIARETELAAQANVTGTAKASDAEVIAALKAVLKVQEK
jgi:hypothetical protein